MSELKDWRGTPIVVGSTVVYPGRGGSAMWLNEATVLEVGEVDVYHLRVPRLKVQQTNTTGYSLNTGPSYLRAIDRVTVVAA